MSLGPFDLTGGPFLGLYTVLLILTVVAGLVIILFGVDLIMKQPFGRASVKFGGGGYVTGLIFHPTWVATR